MYGFRRQRLDQLQGIPLDNPCRPVRMAVTVLAVG